MSKEVLITGASGFLGSILSKSLIESKVNIISFGRGDNNDVQGDFLKDDAVIKIPKGIDLVIHAAGKAHTVPKNGVEKREFFKINFEGTKKLCKGLIAGDVKPTAFIFISTIAVYGIEKGQLISESQSLKGETPYAKSKIMAEEWLQSWAQEHDITLGILRLPLIVGLNPPGNLGALINGIRSGRYLGIGKSDARKSMVWAEDIASILPKLSEVGGVYNLTDGYHPTFKELEDCIAYACGKKSPIHLPIPLAKFIAAFGDLFGRRSPINTNKLQKMMSTLTFDDSKAREILDWQPSPVLHKIPAII